MTPAVIAALQDLRQELADIEQAIKILEKIEALRKPSGVPQRDKWTPQARQRMRRSTMQHWADARARGENALT